MVMTGNTRIKRKNNCQDLKTEPVLKALQKGDIIIQFEALQKKYDTLEGKKCSSSSRKSWSHGIHSSA
jgi:hypothetical protein